MNKMRTQTGSMELRFWKLFLVFMFLLLSVITISGCNKKENTTQYKVVDSGMWISDSGGGKIWWLDNERVLFPSNEKLQPNGGPSKIMIWNTSTGGISSSGLSSVICADRNEVFWGERDSLTNTVKYYHGALENPQLYPPPNPDMVPGNCFECGWVPRAGGATIPYHIKLRGENFLEVVESMPDPEVWPQERRGKKEGSRHSQAGVGAPALNKVVYYERSGAKGVELPFQLGGWNSYEVTYIDWRKAYLIRPRQYYKNKPLRLWWLQQDGTVHEDSLPDKLPFTSAGGIDFHPVKAGIFVTYNGGSSAGSDGAYLCSEGKALRIISHMVQNAVVSPDGCRVVFIHAKSIKEYISRKKPFRTLKMIDFCKGRTHK